MNGVEILVYKDMVQDITCTGEKRIFFLSISFLMYEQDDRYAGYVEFYHRQ